MMISDKNPQGKTQLNSKKALNLRYGLAFATALISVQVLGGAAYLAQADPPATAPATAPEAAGTPASPTVPATPGEARAAAFKATKWDITQAGREFNLDGYKITFEDNFDKLSVTEEGGKGPWLAPVRSSFGGAKFQPPGPDGPFTVADGILTIRMEKYQRDDGKTGWKSGLMQTVDSKGQGLVQQYGYWEMRAQFPESKGAWPAFWLLSQNGYTDYTKTRTEIDIVEWYGGDQKGHHATVHLWPNRQSQPEGPAKHVGVGQYSNFTRWDTRFKLPAAPLVEGKLTGWHTYGGEVTPEWVIIYMDGHELARFPTQPEFKTPLYMLVNLTLGGGGTDTKEAISPMEMKVDYVRVYAKG
jgi:beta-glucanase (GH16 family)